MKLIDLHKKWVKDLELPDYGLCHVFSNLPRKYEDRFLEFSPIFTERVQLRKEGKSELYWASDNKNYLCYEYTPLRQTIVLLICAMNNEL